MSFTILLLLIILIASIKSDKINDTKKEIQPQYRKLTAVSVGDGTISGNGTSTFEAHQSVTVILTARDSSGNLIGVGGDLFFAQITFYDLSNSEVDYTEAEMIDNNDGTYQYTFVSLQEGSISVNAFLKYLNIIKADFWDNTALTGSPDYQYDWTEIDQNWGGGLVTPTQGDYVSGRFTSHIIAPQDDAYTFYFLHDNGGRLWWEGVQKINHWLESVTEESFTENLVQDKEYEMVAEFYESTGGAKVHLYWSYSSQAKTIIPSSNYAYREYVSSVPLSATVDPYSGSGFPTNDEDDTDSNTTDGSENNSPSCGDGFRQSNENCDDGNSKNNDGCSSQCNIERYHIGIGGSSTSADTGSKCGIGYEVTADKTSCSISKKSKLTIILEFIFSIMVAFGLTFSIVNAIATFTSVNGSFIFWNQMQLIVLLPGIGAYLPSQVTLFIADMNYSLLGVQFLIFDEDSFLMFRNLKFAYEQPDSYFRLINIKSGNSFITIQGTLIAVLIIIGVNLIILIIYLGVKNMNLTNKIDQWIKKWIDNVYHMFFFDIYIKFWILNYLFVLMITISIISKQDLETGIVTFSAYSAIMMFLIQIMLSIFLIMPYIIQAKNRQYVNIFYSGLKESKLGHMYLILFLLHRLCLGVTIFPTSSKNLNIKLLAFILIHLCHGGYMIALRPYIKKVDNINEIIGGLIYLILTILLFNSSPWTESMEALYITIIIMNNVIFMTITGTVSGLSFYRKIGRKKKTTTEAIKDQADVEKYEQGELTLIE